MSSVEYGTSAKELCTLYEEYGWWSDREDAKVRQALRNTDEVVVLRDESDEPVASARVMTDYVYYAMVYDVIVAADARGEGVGRELMSALADHPRLQDVNLALLAREGLVPFYESCGFEVRDDPVERPGGEAEPLSWMAYIRE